MQNFTHNINQRKWWIFFAMSIAVVMSNTEMTAMNLAVVAISKELHLTLHHMQWIINSFLLCNAALMVTGGKLADIFGRRRIFILGIFVFVLASLLGGFAQNLFELISSRILQGISAAIGFTMTTVIIYTAFPQTQRNMALGWLTGIIGFSIAVGPTLGGFLTDAFSWRWIFFINVPLGILAIILTLLFVPKDHVETQKRRMDYGGIFTLTLGIAGIIFAISQANPWHWSSPIFWCTFLLAILSLVIFFQIERKHPHPLIHLDVLYNSPFLVGCLVRMLIVYIIYVPLFIISLYMQNILDYTPAKAGVVMLAMTFTIGIFAPIGGWLTAKISARITMLIATTLSIITFFLLSQLTTSTTVMYLCVLLFLAGVVYGIFSPTILRATMISVADENLGVASGIFYTMSVTGGACGVAIASAIMSRQGVSYLQKLAAQNNMSLTLEKSQKIMQTLYSSHSGQGRYIHLLHHLNPQITTFSRQAFMYAFDHVMLLGSILALLATIIILLSPKKENQVTHTEKIN